jgi:hypothetical protein
MDKMSAQLAGRSLQLVVEKVDLMGDLEGEERSNQFQRLIFQRHWLVAHGHKRNRHLSQDQPSRNESQARNPHHNQSGPPDKLDTFKVNMELGFPEPQWDLLENQLVLLLVVNILE